MTDIQLTFNEEQLLGIISRQDGMGELIQSAINQFLQVQCSQQLGAGRHERSAERTGYRNGNRSRTLFTRIGRLTLQVPQVREGVFSTEIFTRYQRSEQALVLAIIEMVINGVSTRKVTKIYQELCGEGISKSLVSDLCSRLDPLVEAWRTRTLDEYPFVFVDGIVIKIRDDNRVRSYSALIALGIAMDGTRNIIGLHLGDSESESTWTELFKGLKSRGIKGLEYIISDSHSGLVAAKEKQFQGVTWQRCQCHFTKNVLDQVRREHKTTAKEKLHTILQAGDDKIARSMLELHSPWFEQVAPKALNVLEDGFDDAIAVLHLPEVYRKKLRTTNIIERLNEEIRRRERVIRIFPNEKSAIRLIGALLMEKHEEWSSGRLYIDMSEYNIWKENNPKQKLADVHQFTKT